MGEGAERSAGVKEDDEAKQVCKDRKTKKKCGRETNGQGREGEERGTDRQQGSDGEVDGQKNKEGVGRKRRKRRM